MIFQHVELFANEGQVQEHPFNISKDLIIKTNVNYELEDQNTLKMLFVTHLCVNGESSHARLFSEVSISLISNIRGSYVNLEKD